MPPTVRHLDAVSTPTGRLKWGMGEDRRQNAGAER